MSSSEIIKMPSVMSVIKRNGEKEVVSFDKISRRIKNLIESCEFKSKLNIDYVSLAQKVCTDIYDGVKTSELDELAAQVCASLTTQNPEYGVLASRIAISNHHKKTSPSFSEAIDNLYNTLDEDGNRIEVITKEVFNVVKKHKTKLNNIIDYTRDYDIDYFGFKTLERAYLLRVNGEIIERPQHMFLRVAIGIHGNDIKSVIECYDVLSQKKAIHATPTLFNAGTNGGQLASCFLLGINDDSIDGIYDALKETALISKNSGGIGIHVHDIRSKGANIATAKGASTGLVPMLRVFNDTARYVNQGGKRNGSFAIYLEPWHSDIFEFLELRKNQGSDELRARDLFYAMWIPDLFMKRVQENGVWSLMCPHRCPGLSDVYGKEFEDLYEKYEKDGKYRKQVPAQEIWFKILESQVETGTPYILFKDHVNRKSNQMNLGTIKSSNLCCEITEFTSKDEIAVCNLASVALSSFVKAPDVPDIVKIKSIPNCVFCSLAKSWCERWNILTEIDEISEPIKGQKYPQISVGDFKGGYTDFIEDFPVNYDYEELIKVTKVITRNLNKIIDKTTYPVGKAKNSNNKHRPIGIGVQGLADVFMKMRIPFDSDRAKFLNEKIFETIYFAALTESNELAIKKAEKSKKTDLNFLGAYESFEGSPFSQGKFQFDLWEQQPLDIEPKYDWKNLKESVMTHGTTNSLLLAPMPTASTAQILGNNECFEPITSNIYVRRVLAGEFVLCNKYLQEELLGIGKWNNEVKNSIIANQGSVQHLKLPDCVKDVFKTVWEIKQRVVIDYAADRGKFIDQSQSMNLFMPDTSPDKVTSALFYGWKKGLKTGMYYLRTRPKSNAQQFTIDVAPEPACESCSG